MKDRTTAIIKAVFQLELGQKIIEVNSFSNEKPNKDNLFLFNQAFNQFQGIAKTLSDEYVFFLQRESGSWVLTANKV